MHWRRRNWDVTDLDALRAEVEYQCGMPPWCLYPKGFCVMPKEWFALVVKQGRYFCLTCEFHNREAGTHPEERMRWRKSGCSLLESFQGRWFIGQL